MNIENKRIYDDTAGWSGAVDASFSALKTSSPLLNLALRPRVQYKTPKHYYFLIGDLVYSKGKTQVFSNQGMVHFRYAYRLKWKAWKWESYVQSQYNQLLGQQIRNIIGSGIRWKFYDNQKGKYFIGTSLFYEYERISKTLGVQTGTRLNQYLSWFIDPKSNYYFTAATYYQPLLSNFKDYKFMGQYSLMFRVKKHIELRVEWNSFYDSRPAPNVQNWTYNTSFGLRYSFN